MTIREEFALVVQRLTPDLMALGLGYTPAIRAAEQRLDEVGLRFDRGEAAREEASAAIRAIEELWQVAIARARRRSA